MAQLGEGSPSTHAALGSVLSTEGTELGMMAHAAISGLGPPMKEACRTGLELFCSGVRKQMGMCGPRILQCTAMDFMSILGLHCLKYIFLGVMAHTVIPALWGWRQKGQKFKTSLESHHLNWKFFRTVGSCHLL